MRFGLRRRTVLVAVGSFAAGLLLLLVVSNVLLGRRLSSEAQSVLESRVAAQRANLAVSRGGVRVREAPGDAALDGASWVFRGRRLLNPQMMPASLRAAAVQLLASGHHAEADVGDTRLLAQPVALGHGTPVTVISAISLAPYEDTQQLTLIGSAAIGVVLLALVAFVANRSVSGALRPVRRMTEQAATWSERDLHRRFGLGVPHDELTALAATLDGLLGRVDASFQHEQRFSAEVAHELRTPLARQRAEIELALRPGGSDEEVRSALPVVLSEVDRMTVIIDTLVAAAQAELDPRRGVTTSSEVTGRAFEALGGTAAEAGVALEDVNSSVPVQVDVELAYAVQTLMPVVDNALRYARTHTKISCEGRGTHAIFTVADDGLGVRADEQEVIFEPGVRGSAAMQTRGAGLGLPLARRLARAVGGDVVPVSGALGGCFEVVLPGRSGVSA